MSTVRSRATGLRSNDDERGGMTAAFDSSYSERGAGLHMNSGMLVLEGIYRGIDDVGGIEHRIGGSSGSGLWDDRAGKDQGVWVCRQVSGKDARGQTENVTSVE